MVFTEWKIHAYLHDISVDFMFGGGNFLWFFCFFSVTPVCVFPYVCVVTFFFLRKQP